MRSMHQPKPGIASVKLFSTRQKRCDSSGVGGAQRLNQGSTDRSRLQVHAVALSRAHDTQREKVIETIWRNEFGRLEGGKSICTEPLTVRYRGPLRSSERHLDTCQKSPFSIAHPAGGIDGYLWGYIFASAN